MGDVTVIADTNLFFECGKISELDWSIFPNDTIKIVVCKPVQSEIDKHKKENGRTRRKAIEWSKIFREMLVSGVFEKVEKEENPRIILKLDPITKPSEVLSSEIDYDSNDNKIVGIAKSYDDELDGEVFLLSHDTGPIATAASANVPYKVIPDEWISTSTDDPELIRLRSENQKLKKQEPKIEVLFESEYDGKAIYVVKKATALENDQVEELINEVKEKRPIETNFDASPERPLGLPSGFMEFVHPTEEMKTQYTENSYPDWIEKCRANFTGLHRHIISNQRRKILEIQAKNTGSRPAEMARIIIEASGDVEFRRPSKNDDDSIEENFRFKSLPSPPDPPQGKWENIHTRSFRAARDFHQRIYPLSDVKFDTTQHLSSMLPRIDNRRDSDGFYWCDPIPNGFTDHAELECENWRHNRETEIFRLEIQSCKNEKAGAIQFTFLANNLTDKVSLLVPVRFEHVDVDVHQRAKDQILLLR